VARKSIWDVEADLKSGSLVELLQDFSAGSTGLQIVYPATQEQPKRVRLLIERIAAAFCRQAPKFWSWLGDGPCRDDSLILPKQYRLRLSAGHADRRPSRVSAFWSTSPDFQYPDDTSIK
jgi:hypothetical protein